VDGRCENNDDDDDDDGDDGGGGQGLKCTFRVVGAVKSLPL